MEDHKRSIAKAVSWRLLGFCFTALIVYIVSRDMKKTLIIAGSADAVKIILYYFHERLWNKVNFGRQKPPEYQI
ncbi:MAG: DUF2061 domain-containing protein [Candidatus Omnitrophica bacterium]|nr:DUF2061 domain-containing protein [Candidatus Omnitrophota bacterium]